MFNITGGEVIIIAIVALVILGPDKLPDFIRRAGRLYGEVKKITNGFKTEFRDVIEEPVREMQDTVNLAKSWFDEGKTAVGTMDDLGWNTPMTPDSSNGTASTTQPEVTSGASDPASSAGIEPEVVTRASDPAAAPSSADFQDPFGAPPSDTPDAVDESLVVDSDDAVGPDEEFDEADDDPNFYDEFGNMITSSEVESRVDRFGEVRDPRPAEGTDA